jgi:hypothetical protein
VALVNHIHLPAGLNGGKAGALDQFADVVDSRVGGGVDFDDIEGIASRNRCAELTAAAGLRGGAF